MRHRFVVAVCFFLTASLFAQVPIEQPYLPPGPELQEPVVPEVAPEDVPDDVPPQPNDADGRQGAVRGEGVVEEGGNLVFKTPDGTEHMRITSGGRIGVGTGAATPAALLDLRGTGGALARLALTGSEFYDPPASDPTGGVAFVLGANRLNNRQLWIGDSARLTPSSSNVILRLHPRTTYGEISALATDGTTSKHLALNENGGNVGIGMIPTSTYKLDVSGHTRVTGNLTVDGSITGASVIGATYQDLAEWVPATSDMEPGTVVVLNHDRTNEVMPSSRAYDTSVAGVVSAQPGIILGVGSASKEQIATTGRVKVRVDATHGPVRVGDLLVTSDKPGYAMKSIPVEIAGISMHRPGTIVGKALEPLASGEGEILVLLSLQ